MHIHWNTDVMMGIGNMLGYRRLNINLRNAMMRLGTVLDADSEVSVQVRSPDMYAPVPGKINAWFTMFESSGMPSFIIENLKKADALIVPSKYCVEIFRPHTEVPIFVVPLGVDPSLFTLVKRSYPKDRPFRWLWIGAKNTRKGWNAVIDVWNMDGPRGKMVENPGLELYLKTTDDDLTIQHQKNAHLDTRLIGDKELVGLYHSAHAFVFPTMSEGYGLTAAEAMATGLPCVTPLHTGIVDFANAQICYPVRHGRAEIMVDSPALAHAGSKFLAPVFPVDQEDLYRQMWNVMDRYTQALIVGFYASKRMSQFTWGASAIVMLGALRSLKNGKNADIMKEAS